MSLSIWDNGVDYVIANTAEEAQAVSVTHHGVATPPSSYAWQVMPDDKDFVYVDVLSVTPDVRVTKTASAWCALNGAGYLAPLGA